MGVIVNQSGQLILAESAPKRNHGSLVKRSTSAFAAGTVDRLTNSFTGTSLSINESLKRDLVRMRHRCRTLVNDNDYGKKFVSMVKTNVVGSKGIRLQARAKDGRGKLDKLDNDALESTWKDFCEMQNCGVTGKLSFLDIQRLISTSVAMEGECFIRFVQGSKYKYGFALQLIEADRVDVALNRDKVSGTNLNRIVMGVELDEFDVPVAYYVMVAHPSETIYTYGNRSYLRIPAQDILHLFVPERIAQARGIPWMHASIRRMDMIGGYEEAELVAARVSASKMGFYTTEAGTEYKGDDDDDGTPIQEAEPGIFEQLPMNTEFTPFDPQHPAGSYNYFMKGALRGVAAGLNLSYTGFTGDLEAVNYSSIRAGLIEERENWRVIQGWFVEHAMARIYERFLSAALTRALIVNAAGVTLPMSKKEKYMSVAWIARGWAWVDPLKDEQANIAAVEAGHRTNSDVVGSTGEDLEEVYERLAWEKELAKQYGLEFNTKTTAAGDKNAEKNPKN